MVKKLYVLFRWDVTIEQIDELYEEITDMEASIYFYEDILLKPSYALSKEERDLKEKIKLQEKEYAKYAPLESLCWYVFNTKQRMQSLS